MNIKYEAPFVVEECFFSYNPEKESEEHGFEFLIPLGYEYTGEYSVASDMGEVTVFVNMKKETPIHEYLEKLIK